MKRREMFKEMANKDMAVFVAILMNIPITDMETINRIDKWLDQEVTENIIA